MTAAVQALPAGAPRVLLVRLRSIGDAVLLTPLVAAIRRERPGALLTLALEEPAAELLAGQAHLDQVLTVGRGPLGRLRALAAMRRGGFDVALDLHGGPTATFLTGMSGAGKRIGLETYRSRWAYDLRLAIPSPGPQSAGRPHTVESNLAIARELGLDPPPDLAPRLTPTAAGEAAAVRALAAAGLDGRRDFLAIHPGAALASKTWPRERFLEVARRLAAGGIAVLLLTPAGERRHRRCDRTTAAPLPQDNLFTLASLPLSGLLAVLARASAFLGNDSGPMHMAAALGVPVVGLFGSQDPRLWHPWGTGHRAIWKGLACSPCRGFTCANPHRFECLDAISVDEVESAVRAALLGARPGHAPQVLR